MMECDKAIESPDENDKWNLFPDCADFEKKMSKTRMNRHNIQGI